MGKLLLFTLCAITISSCAFMDSRQYEREMGFDKFNAPLFNPEEDFDVITGDNGRSYYNDPSIMKRRIPMTESQKAQGVYDKSIRKELVHLENSMSEQDYYHYRKVATDFSNDSERIYFINLSSQDKARYLNSKGIEMDNGSARVSGTVYRRPAVHSYSMQHGSDGSITLGMTKEEVSRTFGSPERLEVAGNPEYENERWTYTKNGVIKQIYFENGTVGGWSQKD